MKSVQAIIFLSAMGFPLGAAGSSWETTASGPHISQDATANRNLVKSASKLKDSVLYQGHGNPDLYSLDGKTGEVLWHYEAESYGARQPHLIDRIVYFEQGGNYLTALDAETGKELWRFEADGSVGYPPDASNGVVYLATPDELVYAIDAKTGGKIWATDTDLFLTSNAVALGGVV